MWWTSNDIGVSNTYVNKGLVCHLKELESLQSLVKGDNSADE